jgi:hypothetical protein
MTPFLSTLVNNWNYHIGLEDASVMKGQSHNIEEFGAPRMQMGGLGDDLVSKYWKWRNEAHDDLNKNSDGKITSPYFSSYGNGSGPISIATGTSIFGDKAETADLARSAAKMATTSNNNDEGGAGEFNAERGGDSTTVWGIKRNYSPNTPPAEYPPMNFKRYKSALRLDDLTKMILMGQGTFSTTCTRNRSVLPPNNANGCFLFFCFLEPSCTMVKTTNQPPKAESPPMKPVTAAIGASAMIAMAGIATAVNALNL